MKLSYIRSSDKKRYVRYDQETEQWNMYEDEDGRQVAMYNVQVESWVADPGDKLYPNSVAERDEMCKSLLHGIQVWERLLDADLTINRPISIDAQTIAALDAEKKERFKLYRQGIKRLKAELEQLQGLKRF